MGFDGAFISDAQGHSGGIWCLWDTSLWSVTVKYHSRQMVHMNVNWKNEGAWDLTAVYGSPHRAMR